MNEQPTPPASWSEARKRSGVFPPDAQGLLLELAKFFDAPESNGSATSGVVGPLSTAHSLEAKLRRAEARYRMLVEQIPAVTFLAGLNEDQNEFYVSPQIEQLLGFSQREWLENPILWFTQLHPEDRDRWHIEFARTCSTGEPFRAEYRFLAKDGRVVWVLGEAKYVRDELGRLVYLQGVAFDITAIKHAEEELRAHNQTLAQRVAERTAALQRASQELMQSNQQLRDGEIRLRAILNTTVDAIISINDAGLIEKFNRSAEIMFGYAAAEVLGKNVSLLMPSPYAEEHDQYLEAYRRTGVRKIIGTGREVVGRRKDGSTFPIDLAVSEVLLEDRRLFTGVVRDITERKQAEAALRQAIDEAEAASRAKSEFVSRTSHELRTPLNAILGFAQLLEMGTHTARQRRQLEQIIKGGKHLLKLINELLDIARIESGKLDLSLEPIHVCHVIEEVVDLTQPLAVTANIRLEMDLAGYENSYVKADRQRFKQVLLNFASNAVKYNCEHGHVTFACVPADDGHLRIIVRDTGAGIPPEKMSRLFSPFDRLGAETSAIEGSGIGLVLCKRLAEAMGGSIGCDSTVGLGTSFYVEFPVVQSRPIAVCEGLTSATESQVLSPDVEYTMLYVEDNLDNISLLEDLLAHRPQVRLLTALQAGLGLELAALHRPDLILLDVHLPDMTGDQFLQKLRANPRIRDIPVIVLSADATEHQINRLLACGAQQYLTKPIDVPNFLEALDKALKERKS